MLFHSTASDIVNLMGITASNQANMLRKQTVAKALDLYSGESLKHLEASLSELFSESEKMTKLTIGTLRKIIHQQAQTYRKAPTRTIEGSEMDQGFFAEISENCSLDLVLKQASRLLKLTKSLLLKVVYTEDSKIRLDIITSNLIENIKTDKSPYDLKSVLIVDYGNTNRIEDIEYSYWDLKVYRRYDARFNLLQEISNPYNGALPFIPLFDSLNTSNSFFLPLDDSLVSLAEAINIKLTDLVYLIRQQSFGVGYLKGSQGGANLRVDPGSLVELPENGEIGFASQKAEIMEVVDAIDKLVKWACISNGLSAGSMSTDPTEQSGISKQWDNKELSEMRADDIALWRTYEKELFNLIRIVWNTHSTQKLSDSATLKIDFAEVETKLSENEQAQADDLKIAQGVLSPVDVLLRDNPDFQADREKAMAHLLTIKDELKELGLTT